MITFPIYIWKVIKFHVSKAPKIVISPGFSQGLQWDFPLAQSFFGYDGDIFDGDSSGHFSGKPSGKLTFTDLPGLVNVNKKLWKITIFNG
jgi:hypothetical protein